MKRKTTSVIFLSLFFLGKGFSQPGQLVEGKIKRVLAGDIYKLEYKGAIVQTRLIGVNLPREQKIKTASQEYYYNPQQAQQARIFATQRLTPGQKVYLEFDRMERDREGYLLVYLWLDREGKEMFNEILLREGYGRLLLRPPNLKYEKQLTEAYEEARKLGRGIWEKEEKKKQLP